MYSAGDIVLNPDGTPMRRRVVKYAPVEHKEPVYDVHKLVLGPLRTREWAMEIGDRFKAGEFMFEPATMADMLEKVMEIGEHLDRSLYLPGFHEVPGYEFDELRGRVNMRRPIGRESQDYREALYALNKLWTGMSQNLKQTYAPDGKDDGGDAAQQVGELMRQQLANRPDLDPRFYQAGGFSNEMLKIVVSLIDALAKRHPAAMVPTVGDYQTINQDLFRN